MWSVSILVQIGSREMLNLEIGLFQYSFLCKNKGQYHQYQFVTLLGPSKLSVHDPVLAQPCTVPLHIVVSPGRLKTHRILTEKT